MATWDEDIVKALERLGGAAHYDSIYEEIFRLRSDLPSKWKAIVRRRMQDLSSDSNGFKGGRDLFYSVEGLGGGTWGLRKSLSETPKAIDLPSGNEAPAKSQVTTYRVLRDTELARKIKKLYNDCCQICDLQLTLKSGQSYSEAHHIIPLGSPHNGPDIPENIIVLCPNHHVLCDYGSIELSLQEIKMKKGHLINQASIDYHNNVIRKMQ
jgi:predicted HNH restriction endonuclease